MPTVELHILEGYDGSAKRRLGEALTDAVRLVVPAAPELVTIMIHEMPAEHYYRGRTSRVPAPAKADPAGVVRSFLAAMEARKIERARTFLAPDFEMTFPGTAPMHRLEDLIQWAAGRYAFVTKTYQGFDTMQSPGDAAVVYCRGTLSGQWLDGADFAGIRFIDRFEVIGDSITRQEVWNDIAETKGAL